MKNNNYKNENWLYTQYILMKKTDREIGRICQVHHSQITRWRKKLGIKGRQKGVNQKETPTVGAMHLYIKKYKQKPDSCDFCGKKTKDLDCSNKDHKYSRNLEDYRYICRSCHRKYDLDNGLIPNMINNLKVIDDA